MHRLQPPHGLTEAQRFGERTLVGPDRPQRTLHFAGTVRLGRKALASETITIDEPRSAQFDCHVVDAQEHVIIRVADYRSVPMPASIPPPVMAELRATFKST